MKPLVFCTGNAEKFDNAAVVCRSYDLPIAQQPIDIDEIQSEDSELILHDKLAKAFQAVGGPVVVSDDSWEIPGLNGFPGAYMKSINHWFSPEDYLRLTLPLKDRSIYIFQWLGYSDGTVTKTFHLRSAGTILKEIKGQYGSANHKLVTMDGDDGKSIAEIYDQGLNHEGRDVSTNWHEFAKWYQTEYAR